MREYSFRIKFAQLAAALMLLKLLGIISISWTWVFSPIWIPFIIGCIGNSILYIMNKYD